jgi:hypothetical protein
MSTRRRVWLVLGLVVILLTAFAAYLLHRVSVQRAASIEAAIENGPLKIAASQMGDPRAGSWDFYLDPSGNATLKVWSVRTSKTRRLKVTKAQLDEFRKALKREYFSDLADSYGESVFDGSTTTIEVTAGDFTKKVELRDLENPRVSEPEKYREASRAVHVLKIIRGWFDETT